MKIIKTYLKGKPISYKFPSTDKKWTVQFSKNITGISFVGQNNSSNISEQILEIYKFNTNLSALNNYCFNNCNNLNQIQLSPYIQKINEYCFNNCKNIENISFDIYDSYLPTTTENIPKLNTIENNAFVNCKELKSLILPESISSISQIDENAFNGSNLTSITFLGITSEQLLGT